MVTIVSTIEHVGLRAYGESCYDLDGDMDAILEIRRVLNDKGKLLLITPFGGIYTVNHGVGSGGSWRIYDEERLERLLTTFKIEESEYYIFRKRWIRVSKNLAKTVRQGLVCIVALPKITSAANVELV